MYDPARDCYQAEGESADARDAAEIAGGEFLADSATPETKSDSTKSDGNDPKQETSETKRPAYNYLPKIARKETTSGSRDAASAKPQLKRREREDVRVAGDRVAPRADMGSYVDYSEKESRERQDRDRDSRDHRDRDRDRDRGRDGYDSRDRDRYDSRDRPRDYDSRDRDRDRDRDRYDDRVRDYDSRERDRYDDRARDYDRGSRDSRDYRDRHDRERGRYDSGNSRETRDVRESRERSLSPTREPKPHDPAAPAPSKQKRPSQRGGREAAAARAAQYRAEMEKREARAQAAAQQGDQVGDSLVRNHYNQAPERGVVARQSSPIIKLRNFNNFIKSVLIQKQSLGFGMRVIDMGCGKGGDLNKWSRQRVRDYIGVDIADVSVQQASERYHNMQPRPRFYAEFHVADAFGTPLIDIINPRAFPVDCISSQFAMHYAFATEELARSMLTNVSNSLCRDGVFLGTIPNSDKILEGIAGGLKESEPKEGEERYGYFGNSVYKVEFNTPPTKDQAFRPPFGHKYTFYLQDAINNVPEYVVPFEVFRALASDYNLELIYKKPFLEMFDEEVKNDLNMARLAERMKVFKEDGSLGIDGDQREACGFYLAFAFRKLGA
jgi:mRNA (guanine-N7-)-methyltransferase